MKKRSFQQAAIGERHTNLPLFRQVRNIHLELPWDKSRQFRRNIKEDITGYLTKESVKDAAYSPAQASHYGN